MSQITFTGAVISTGSFTNDGGSVSRLIHVKANPTKAVRSAMKWEELPECADMAKLAGELTATNLVLTPNQDGLFKHEVECECTSVSEFSLHRIQEKDGGSRKLELRFRLKITERAALAKLENYCEKVGETPASLRIGYTSQGKLPLDEKEEKASAAKA